MKLLIYRNEKEFTDFLKQGNIVFPFIFKDTGDSIADDPQITVDVTAAVWHIERERQNIQPFIFNFKNATDATIAIASESVRSIVEQHFYTIFDEIEYIFNEDKYKTIQKIEVLQSMRKAAYYYLNAEHFEKLYKYAQDNGLLYIGFSQTETISKKLNNGLDRNLEFFLDIDSLLFVIENNKTIIYLLEGLLQSFPNATILFHQENAEKAKQYFPLFFDRIISIDEKVPECALEQGTAEPIEKQHLIVNLTDDKLTSLLESFNERLAGHHHFKAVFARAVRNFVLLNKIGKRKVLSIFLFGDSGVGKTETARIIQELLCKDTSLAKINFGNYSSKDSLNNLIGSPLGYIGCQDGELGKKIDKSRAGVILFDEIEKADNNVINFFSNF